MWTDALHSIFDLGSPQAGELAALFHLFLIICSIIWGLVTLAVLMGLMGSTRRFLAPHIPQRPEPITTTFLWLFALSTAAIVLTLTFFSYRTQRDLYSLKPERTALTVQGRQWWWHLQYDGEEEKPGFTAANEIIIPADERITLKLEGNDVIHSFWMPSLMGKQDLIPGRSNMLHLAPVKAGIYRGQCAEFCGLQHAHMLLLVEAKPRADYDAWRASQYAAAQVDENSRGAQLFLSKGCASCHRVRGTAAGGNVGPDLTHVASRKTLAAGTLRFNTGSLAAWIADPQKLKPGAQMPAVDLAPDELLALVGYVESLK